MTNPSQSLAYPHIFRPKWWQHAVNLFSLGCFIVILIVTILMLIFPIAAFDQTGSQSRLMLISLSCIFIPFLVFDIFLSIFFIVIIISYFFAYIKTTPEGIEYRYWPYLHIRSGWDEVDSISRYLFVTDVLYVNHFQQLGTCLSVKLSIKPFSPEKWFIPLANFNGWKGGLLEADIRKFAPQLFDVKAVPLHSSEPSQNDRLLSALCHGSIFLSWFGIFVPIIVGIAQQGKSAYLKFQAIQAFVWQMLVAFLTIIGFIVLVVGLALFSYSAGNYRNMDLLPIIQMAMALVGSLCLIGFHFAASIYAVIGIIKMAQGKDFQYFLIGKLLRKF